MKMTQASANGYDILKLAQGYPVVVQMQIPGDIT